MSAAVHEDGADGWAGRVMVFLRAGAHSSR